MSEPAPNYIIKFGRYYLGSRGNKIDFKNKKKKMKFKQIVHDKNSHKIINFWDRFYCCRQPGEDS